MCNAWPPADVGVRRDCRWSIGPEVRGRRTLQELSAVCPVWQYEMHAHSDEDLAYELGWNVEFWAECIARDSETAVLPTDWRW